MSQAQIPTVQTTNVARKILLLDDHAELAETIQTYLSADNLEVTVVHNGVEGLKLVMCREFDAIVCDLMMPHLPGDKFYWAATRVKPHLANRFLFITGFGRSPAFQGLPEHAKEHVIFKPFNVADLKAAIFEILEREGPANDHPRDQTKP